MHELEEQWNENMAENAAHIAKERGVMAGPEVGGGWVADHHWHIQPLHHTSHTLVALIP
jgi:hypothetical protein